MSTATFKPQVWTSPTAPAILICGNRWAHGAPSPATAKPGKVGHTFAISTHPAAIAIESGTVFFRYEGPPEHTEWDMDGRPETWGISSRCAALALAECYRVISWQTDAATLGYCFTIDESKFQTFRKKSMPRNVGIFLQWDRWNRERLGMAARSAIVRGWGYECTPSALLHVKEDAGLTHKT